MTDDTKAEAVKEKELGNEFYKKKEFEQAHTHYDKAIELDPTNISFHTNKAAAYFEEKKYEECIELCTKAIEVGRENQADFKMIARAMERIGNAHLKLGDFEQTLVWFDKSLSEFRNAELVKRRVQVEKQRKEKERLEAFDPEKAQGEKSMGNEFFREGKFPEAMKHYSAAIDLDPENAILYSNRAACYTKLMEFQLALADCEKCIKIDSTFIKGYIRKGAALMALKEYMRAQRAFEDALNIDSNNQEAKDGLKNAYKLNDVSPEEQRKRALQDPEVQAILGDPVMRMILEQMSNDPSSIQEHIKNPEIADKIRKLRDAGIIQVRGE